MSALRFSRRFGQWALTDRHRWCIDPWLEPIAPWTVRALVDGQAAACRHACPSTPGIRMTTRHTEAAGTDD